ncbi:fervidolysin. Serine peptidase. MEROPS family S08A [Syntrophobacter fumaroxidans MPOB]|uniref:Fervidolysin. Serine peptidase. MEROPS family S08A n=2 Tax=Syntrophobacter TaxID=29526 RepID=A0LME2_SYNFM|nr:fervidolysin. Serine peptidase. MEROPS family S08A [Syntrophobacter fumaroxidans MPOB]
MSRGYRSTLGTLVVFCAILAIAATIPSAWAGKQKAGREKSPNAESKQGSSPVGGSAVSSPAAASPVASGLRDAVRKGKHPAQLAGHTGNIKPTRNGPHRNDPAEGVPKHAYSPFDEKNKREHPCPAGGCDSAPDHVLIKMAASAKPPRDNVKGGLSENAALNRTLSAHGVERMEPVFRNARAPKAGERILSSLGKSVPKPDLTKWYRARISKSKKKKDIHALVDALSGQPGVEYVEPDYYRRPVGAPIKTPGTGHSNRLSSPPDGSTDPLYGQQWHLDAANIPLAWQWLEDQGFSPGGSRDIVVAVIDTGVDYNHPDLAANMWVNSREIPGNGIDDDANGFIDDVHGVNVVSNSWNESGNPLDDHGHGTHVAGIIAAQGKNGLGGVGVAYNVQVMAIKAAQYSGVLATSDIAEAIYYAVSQGADIINMSFGGYARSQVEEDALAVAFEQAVLVAAAGNDGAINLPCIGGRDMYPAAYNWVLGVMASTPSGLIASFSNTDCVPHDSHEYELMAPGVDIWSTFPNEQYAAWDGTSMAAPVVSGIAALLRTKWTDKELYTSRFIMGQIAANAGPVADALASLTVAPKPELSYLEHWLFDTTSQSAVNDNDGIVDAGETVDLAIVIRNHWGKADPVTVKLEAWAEGAFQADPYVTIPIDTVDYGAVGSFNWDDNGLIYDEQGVIVGVAHPFQFIVSQDCPNDHVIPFRLTITARNGLDPMDTTVYTTESRFYQVVQRGRELPRYITEDTVLTKDYFWILPGQTRVNSGITLTISEGAQIQWGSPAPQDPYAEPTGADISVYGNLLINGTYHEPVELFPLRINQYNRKVSINTFDPGTFNVKYTRVDTPEWGMSGAKNGPNSIDHCIIFQDVTALGGTGITMQGPPRSITNSIIYSWPDHNSLIPGTANTCLFEAKGDSWAYHMSYGNARLLINSTFIQNNTENRVWGLYWYGCNEDCYQTELEASVNSRHINNAFLSKYWDPNINHWMRTSFQLVSEDKFVAMANNYWGTTSTTLIDAAIKDLNDVFGIGTLVYQPILTTPATTTYPFVVDITLSTAGNPDASVVGAEAVTFNVTFNRDMDTSAQPQVSFGPDTPLTDYTVHPVSGGWTDPRTWVGTFNVTPITGDGYQLIRVAGARAADDPWLVTGNDAGRFRFEIITSGIESMNLQATGGEGYIDLAWTQNDFELLAGFNLYKSTAADGSYTRLNSIMLPSGQRAFRDTNVQPGQPAFYKFTVVKTDMSESKFSNVATATPIDTIPPVISHSPITSAEPGLPVSLFADVTDNVGVSAVTLHFRPMAGSSYSARAMIKTTGNRYSATLEGTLLTPPGIEYYISATDGISTVYSGRPEYPYQVGVVDRPVVTAVSPGNGPDAGGTPVTVAGSNFKAGSTVTFGGAAAGNISVVSGNQITCETPPHFPELVDVAVSNPDGQSGVLLRGYTYASEAASLSLPNVGGGQYAIVQVPINASVQGLAAADLKVTFNNGVLHARGVSNGSLTPGWSVAAHTGTPGEVRISMASPGGTVAGSGVLVNIEFEVVGTPGGGSALHPVDVSLNDGAIPVQTADGSFTVDAVYGISGTVVYWKDGTGIPGTLLTATGERAHEALSGSGGEYGLSGLPAGDYSVSPAKSDDTDGISAYDASLVLQHAVGLISLTGHQSVAADVNKTGAITAMDATYILQKAVGLIALPFPGAGVVWEFSPQSRTYSNLGANLTGQNYTGILIGDVSGNWSSGAQGQSVESGSAPALTPMTARAPVRPGLALSGKARLWVGRALSDPSGVFAIPLKVKVQKGEVFSGMLTLHYSTDRYEAVSVGAGSVAQGAMLVSNLSRPGRIRIALAAPAGFEQSGDLVWIKLKKKRKEVGPPKVVIKRAVLNDNHFETLF